MLRRVLLVCGILASIVYVGVDILAAIRYPDYHSFTSRVISELMASGAPTEGLVDPPFLLYGLLMMAFGAGVWMSGCHWRVHTTGALLFACGAIGLLGPTVFEMNVRGAGGDPAADILHIALTAVLGAVIVASVAFAASIQERRLRLYSLATLLIMIAFSVVTSFEARGLGTGAPTPWVGLAERVNIGAFLLWVVVLAIWLLRVREPLSPASPSPVSARGDAAAERARARPSPQALLGHR